MSHNQTYQSYQTEDAVSVWLSLRCNKSYISNVYFFSVQFQHVALPNSPQSSRERLQNLSRALAERYKLHGHNGSRQRSATFYLLIDLMYFFDLYHEQQYDEALDVNISCFAVVFDILVKTNAVPFVT